MGVRWGPQAVVTISVILSWCHKSGSWIHSASWPRPLVMSPLERGNTPFPFQGPFKRNHPCLHTVSQTHMELLPARWQMAYGNLVGLVGEAPWHDRKDLEARTHCWGDTLQDRQPWVWSGHLSPRTWPKGSHVQVNSDACCSPTPKHRPCLPMAPVDWAHSLFLLPHISEPAWPPESHTSPSPPPSWDRCFCLRLAKPSTRPSFNLFPSKWQKSARQRGVLSWGEGKSKLSDGQHEAGLTGLRARPRTQGERETAERLWNPALGVKHLSHPGCGPPVEGVWAGAGQVPRGSLYNLLPPFPLLKRPGGTEASHGSPSATPTGSQWAGEPSYLRGQSIPKGNPQWLEENGG